MLDIVVDPALCKVVGPALGVLLSIIYPDVAKGCSADGEL